MLSTLKTRQADTDQTNTGAEAVIQTKRLAEAVKNELGDLVTTHKKVKAKPRLSHRPSPTIPDYSGLTGDWLSYYKVAQAYVGKVPTQDRDDTRHDIMLELDRATKRDGKPLPELRAYRIASFMIAAYWRERLKREVKVCIYNGVATEPNCANCRHKPKNSPCPYQAYRPIQSLDQPTADCEAYQCRLLDTVADDTAIEAIDIDASIDASLWWLGCPIRLVEIADKIKKGLPLNKNDQKYLERFRKRYQLKLV